VRRLREYRCQATSSAVEIVGGVAEPITWKFSRGFDRGSFRAGGGIAAFAGEERARARVWVLHGRIGGKPADPL
jgi:hypothetical protein